MEKLIETGVANASEKAATSVLQKLKIPTAQIFPNNFSKEFPENFTLLPKIKNK